MDIKDRYIAKILFKNKIFQYKGQAFEDFFVGIMVKANPEFQAVKAYGNTGDRKNDGFIRSTGTYYQVFAPEDITKYKTIYDAANKMEDNLKGLYENWNDTCKIQKFYFVVNDKYEGLPPQLIQKVEELRGVPLYADISIDCFTAKDLERVFEELDQKAVQDVVGFIPDATYEMIEYGALEEIVSFLLTTELPGEDNETLIVPDFTEKIQFNNLSKEIGTKLIVGSYQEGFLKDYFDVNPGIKEILQRKFHAIYKRSCEVISDMQENAADCRCCFILEKVAPKNTLPIHTCIWVLMAYYFSTCDIFEEPQ